MLKFKTAGIKSGSKLNIHTYIIEVKSKMFPVIFKKVGKIKKKKKN